MRICDAFEQAQLGVSITHGTFQANIFKLLVKDIHTNEHDRRKPSINVNANLSKDPLQIGKRIHKCSTFGPFQKGSYKLTKPFEVPLKSTVTKV